MGVEIERKQPGPPGHGGCNLGTMVTVADAEATGVMLAWEEYDRVALNSQGFHSEDLEPTVQRPALIDRGNPRITNAREAGETGVGEGAQGSKRE